MQCFVELMRKDGVITPIPEVCRDTMPEPGDVIPVEIGGSTLQVRVERIRRGHATSTKSGVEAIHYIEATEL